VTLWVDDGRNPPIPYRASNFDGVLTLAPNWVQAEFNIFGACCKHQANFNSGATLTVRTSVNDGTPNAYCTEPGFTAETNNLTLGQCSAIGGALPAIVFTEAQLDPPPPPIFSAGPGTYLCAQTVSISDPGATIFFTTDGSTPSQSSAKYSGAISVEKTETINAMAVNRMGASTVVTATYTCATYDTFKIDITVGTDDARTDSAIEATLTTNSGATHSLCLKYSDNGSTSFCPQSHPGITWEPGHLYTNTLSWDSGATSLADLSTLKISLAQFPGFGKGDDNWDIQAINVEASSSSLQNKNQLILSRSGTLPVQIKSCYARLKHPQGLNPTSVVFNFNGAAETVLDDDGPHTCPYCQETQP